VLIKDLCEACHDRLATVSTTSISDGHAEVTRLCNTCCRQLLPEDFRVLVSGPREAHCCYCGALATVGAMDPCNVILGTDREMKFKCFDCSRELFRYLAAALSGLGEGLTGEEELRAIRIRRDDAERHMQRWVQERRRDRDG
jgi:protein-arginine kinase activator protein McsA